MPKKTKRSGLGGGADLFFGDAPDKTHETPETPPIPAKAKSKITINASFRIYPADKKLFTRLQAFSKLQGEKSTAADIFKQALALLKIDMDFEN